MQTYRHILLTLFGSNSFHADEADRSRLLDGMDQINTFLKQILTSDDDGGVEAVRKAIDLYFSCVNTDLIEMYGAQSLIHVLASTGIFNNNASKCFQLNFYSRTEHYY